MKIEIGDAFANDEHTAADGAYLRLLRARKWLYLVAIAAALQAHGSINYQALNGVLQGVLNFRPNLVRAALLLTLTPLILQYALLLVQLLTSYRVIAQERLLKRRDEAFDKARALIRVAASSIDNLKATIAAEDVELKRRVKEEASRRKQVKSFENLVGTFSPRAHEGETARNSLKDFREKLSAAKDQVAGAIAQSKYRNMELLAAEEHQGAQLRNFQKLQRDTPEDRLIFRLAEYGVDLIRISVPIGFAVYAWALLVTISS
jgi:Sec-independent protein translocase protein TatA